VLPDSSWRARNGQGFDLGAFTILWDEQVARCPVGQTSRVSLLSNDGPLC
jgi:hypothetical protein